MTDSYCGRHRYRGTTVLVIQEIPRVVDGATPNAVKIYLEKWAPSQMTWFLTRVFWDTKYPWSTIVRKSSSCLSNNGWDHSGASNM